MLKDLGLVADASSNLFVPTFLVELCLRYTAAAGENRLDATTIICRTDAALSRPRPMRA